MGIVKSNPMDLELSSEAEPTSAPGTCRPGRFQVIVEYSPGVCVPTVIAESPQEAVEAFMLQTPGFDEGEITLFDRREKRVVASVKWKMSGTEIGLRVPHRQNVFYDWHLGLLALEVRNRRLRAANSELMSEMNAHYKA